MIFPYYKLSLQVYEALSGWSEIYSKNIYSDSLYNKPEEKQRKNGLSSLENSYVKKKTS